MKAPRKVFVFAKNGITKCASREMERISEMRKHANVLLEAWEAHSCEQLLKESQLSHGLSTLPDLRSRVNKRWSQAIPHLLSLQDPFNCAPQESQGRAQGAERLEELCSVDTVPGIEGEAPLNNNPQLRMACG